MKTSLLRMLVRLHRWFGLALAVPLVIVMVSGALLVFKNPLWVPADWRHTTLAQPEIDTALAAALTLDEAWVWVDVAGAGRGFHVLGYPDDSEAMLRPGATATQDAPPRLAAAHFIFQLHTRLLAGEVGRSFVRLVGPLAVASVVLGLWLWWPRRSGWRARDLRNVGLRRPVLLKLHMAWGAAAALVILPLLVSGALLAHNATIRAWLAPFAAEPPPPAAEAAALRFAPGELRSAIAVARRVWPEGRLTQISRPDAAATQLTLKFRLPGEQHQNGRSTLRLDLAQGRVTSLRDARRSGWPATYDDVLYPFHTTHLGGVVQAWLWLAAAFVLLGLVASGVTAWIRSIRR
jgi:uncharacterized iron-regulated membrane protein